VTRFENSLNPDHVTASQNHKLDFIFNKTDTRDEEVDMFNQPSELSPWWIESSHGFSIKQTNRFEMTYKDTEKSVSFEIDPGDSSITVFSKTILSAKTQTETRALTPREFLEVTQRVRAALEFTGKSFEIV
jgi:hypothetical protein